MRLKLRYERLQLPKQLTITSIIKKRPKVLSSEKSNSDTSYAEVVHYWGTRKQDLMRCLNFLNGFSLFRSMVPNLVGLIQDNVVPADEV